MDGTAPEKALKFGWNRNNEESFRSTILPTYHVIKNKEIVLLLIIHP
jgi:hypothetical protein